MSYHIYTTEGIILKRTAFGEANILLHILTSDLGLILASAQAARLSSSKLRSALQEYTLVSISCVKSKNGWKITNVIEKENFFFDYPSYSRRILSQIVFVLIKMIPGESPHKEIFQTVRSGLDFLKTLPEKEALSFEILAVFRILYQLGYAVKNPNTEKFLDNMDFWNLSLLEEVAEKKGLLIDLINKAFQESHL